MTEGLAGGPRNRVLILTYNDTDRDPRPLKQIAALRDRYDITVASFGYTAPADVEFVRLDPGPRKRGLARLTGIFTLLLLLRLYGLYVRLDPRTQGPLELLRGRSWDLVLAHDPSSLPVAFRLASRRGVLVDLHEYSPEMGEPGFRERLLYRPYFRWLIRRYATRAAAVTTVSPGIVERYRSDFGLETVLVINATPFARRSPSDPADRIRLVHSGVAAPDRRLEVLVEAVRSSSGAVTMDFFLVDAFPGYLDNLRALAGGDERIRFHDAVAYSDLVATLNRYDVGVHVIAPTSFNNLWALPNKVFDFVQARLGLIVGPSPAMSDLVTTWGIGAVLPSFESSDLRAVLDLLDPATVEGWKQASDHAAASLSGEAQSEIWARMVTELLE